MAADTCTPYSSEAFDQSVDAGWSDLGSLVKIQRCCTYPMIVAQHRKLMASPRLPCGGPFRAHTSMLDDILLNTPTLHMPDNSMPSDER
jgi:hypothetical protein